MYQVLQDIQIKGIAAAVPEHTVGYLDGAVTPEQMKERKKKIRLTGIRERHTVQNFMGGGIASADLCIFAAEYLLKKLAWDREDIDFLIFVSQTPGYKLPSTAFYIQKQLGIGKDCFCFDINLGCSGYVAGLQVLGSLMQNCGEGSKGVLLAGDALSSFIDETDSATSLLFGDAGSATAIICGGASSFPCMSGSDGAGYDRIIIPSGEDKLFMDGPAVFGFTINQVVDGIKGFMEYFQIEKNAMDYFVFHQAQKFIINNLCELLQLEEEKVLRSYENYGNTSVASIPVTLCSNQEALKKERMLRILASGFGVGLSWGTICIEITADEVLPMLTVKEGRKEEK